jgi:hypothetical protein
VALVDLERWSAQTVICDSRHSVLSEQAVTAAVGECERSCLAVAGKQVCRRRASTATWSIMKHAASTERLHRRAAAACTTTVRVDISGSLSQAAASSGCSRVETRAKGNSDPPTL